VFISPLCPAMLSYLFLCLYSFPRKFPPSCSFHTTNFSNLANWIYHRSQAPSRVKVFSLRIFPAPPLYFLPCLSPPCLSVLSVVGVPRATLRGLHLYNVVELDAKAVTAAIAACPHLEDLEVIGL
jgi:hypothetical protein